MLSAKCDLCIVVGDKNSSNTKRLFDVASANTHAVWSDGTLGKIDLTETRNVCIISGASTPTELIKGVFERMIEETKDTAVETAVSDETVEIAPEAVTSEDDRVMDKDEALLAKAVSEMKEGHRYKLGQRVKCRVVLVSDDGVYVSIPSSKKEGFIPNEELAMDGNYEAVKRDLNSESVLECAVISLDKGITLSKKSIDERYKDDELVEGIKAGNEFE